MWKSLDPIGKGDTCFILHLLPFVLDVPSQSKVLEKFLVLIDLSHEVFQSSLNVFDTIPVFMDVISISVLCRTLKYNNHLLMVGNTTLSYLN